MTIRNEDSETTVEEEDGAKAGAGVTGAVVAGVEPKPGAILSMFSRPLGGRC